MSLGSQLEAIYKVKAAYWINRFTIVNLRALMSFSIRIPEDDLMAFPSAVLSPYSQLSLFYYKNNMQALFFLRWRAEHACKQGVWALALTLLSKLANLLRASRSYTCNNKPIPFHRKKTTQIMEWSDRNVIGGLEKRRRPTHLKLTSEPFRGVWNSMFVQQKQASGRNNGIREIVQIHFKVLMKNI